VANAKFTIRACWRSRVGDGMDRGMDELPTRTPRAGGALIALFTIGGAAAGLAFQQPSIGLLAGIAVGVAAAAAVWLLDRRR
jgi:hypothetical protein